MPITQVSRVRTIKSALNIVSIDNVITVYDNSTLTIGTVLYDNYTIIGLNSFIKNLKAFTVIKSLAEIDLPNFLVEDSETDKLYKTLDVEWGSARKQLDLFLGVEGIYSQVGSMSVLNPSGYPFRIYNLMDLFTDNLALELGENSQIAVQVKDVGFGLLEVEDIITIHGSYIEELILKSPDPIYNYTINTATPDPSPSPTPTPTPTPDPLPGFGTLNFVLQLDAETLTYADDDLVPIWQHDDAQHVVTQTIVGLQPIYKLNILNTKPAIYFDNQSRRFDILNASNEFSPIELIPLSGNWLTFVVCNFDYDSNVFTIYDPGNETPNMGFTITRTETRLGFVSGNNVHDSRVIGYTLQYNTWYILALCKRGNVFSFYINGTLAGTATNSVPFKSVDTYLSYGAIGQSSYFGGNSSGDFQGYVSDILIMDSFTDADINNIGNHLKNKYLLTWNNI